jgi:hypothetical protein
VIDTGLTERLLFGGWWRVTGHNIVDATDRLLDPLGVLLGEFDGFALSFRRMCKYPLSLYTDHAVEIPEIVEQLEFRRIDERRGWFDLHHPPVVEDIDSNRPVDGDVPALVRVRGVVDLCPTNDGDVNESDISTSQVSISRKSI